MEIHNTQLIAALKKELLHQFITTRTSEQYDELVGLEFEANELQDRQRLLAKKISDAVQLGRVHIES